MTIRRPAFVLAAPALLLILLLPLTAAPAQAEETWKTDVEVHVISKGAKFVGSSMGGAWITLADADTGELLAQGRTAGSTGDTEKIMRTEHGRDRVLSTPEAAVFRTTLDLDRPRRLEVTARGPLAQKQASAEVSTTWWVIPGKHVTGGDGILLELPGFAVDILSPANHSRPGSAPQTVEITANITMMCGCPITPGGLWDADGYEIRAVIHRNDEVVEMVPMSYAGTASRFEATWTATQPGTYRVTVYAFDPGDGNAGLDETVFLVAE